MSERTIGQMIGASSCTVTPSDVLTSDRIGIELELEAVEDRSEMIYWNVTEDGSLRNNGAEFVLKNGYGGFELQSAVDELFEWLSAHQWEANWRCSTHFHVDMQDFTIDQVAKFLLLFTARETAMFSLSDPDRKYSNFCVPPSLSLPFHKKLMMNFKKVLTNPSLGQKYTALNVLPLVTQGTVEYRGAGPIVDKQGMLTVIHALQDMKATVRASGGQSAEEFLNGVVSDYTPDVANAYSLLKSYVAGPPADEARRAGFFTTTPNPISVLDTLMSQYRSIGGREAADTFFGVIAGCTYHRTGMALQRLDSREINTWEDMMSTHLFHCMNNYEKTLVMRGLNCNSSSTMTTMWNAYWNTPIRMKNRSRYPNRPLEPVMLAHQVAARGISEEYIWNADREKLQRWKDANTTLVHHRKQVPKPLDGTWTLNG